MNIFIILKNMSEGKKDSSSANVTALQFILFSGFPVPT